MLLSKIPVYNTQSRSYFAQPAYATVSQTAPLVLQHQFPTQYNAALGQLYQPSASTVETSRIIEPSAPLEEPLLTDSTPTTELDYDKPPTYDDLVRTGELKENHR